MGTFKVVFNNPDAEPVRIVADTFTRTTGYIQFLVDSNKVAELASRPVKYVVDEAAQAGDKA